MAKPLGVLTKVHLPDGLAKELWNWKMVCKEVAKEGHAGGVHLPERGRWLSARQ
jgi:hypothetical protein